MKEFTVDFRGVKTYNQFYEALVKGLAFPDWCGKNLDAIWDLLTGLIEYPAKVTVIGIDRMPKVFDKKVQGLKEVFQETTKYYKSMNVHFYFEYIDK